jgi:putative ABC transport system ATP-binding protein
VLIVTHDMTVAASCSRTISLRDGRIVDDIDRSTSTVEGAGPAGTNASPRMPRAPR